MDEEFPNDISNEEVFLRIGDCPYCVNVGWYEVRGYQGEDEQVQCEWCHTVRTSKFNLQKDVKDVEYTQEQYDEMAKTLEAQAKVHRHLTEGKVPHYPLNLGDHILLVSRLPHKISRCPCGSNIIFSRCCLKRNPKIKHLYK